MATYVRHRAQLYTSRATLPAGHAVLLHEFSPQHGEELFLGVPEGAWPVAADVHSLILAVGVRGSDHAGAVEPRQRAPLPRRAVEGEKPIFVLRPVAGREGR